MSNSRFSAVSKVVDWIISSSEGIVESGNGVQSADTLACDLETTPDEVMRMAKDDNVGDVRLVGQNEARGRLTEERLKTTC